LRGGPTPVGTLSLRHKYQRGGWRCNCDRPLQMVFGGILGQPCKSAPAKRLRKFCGAARLTAPVGLLLASNHHRSARCVTAQEVGTFSRTLLSRRARRLCAS